MTDLNIFEMQTVIAGVDYGAKLSGNTAVAILKKGKVELFKTKVNENADDFIVEVLTKHQVKMVFIDAPLSLPRSYQGIKEETEPEFFYRQCDKETGAMSPLFLGGLTARAIALKYLLNQKGIEVYETYPSYLCRLLNIERVKTADGVFEMFHRIINELNGLFGNIEPQTIHEIDALLALYSAIRFCQQQHVVLGDASEGEILV
jgi:predicted nuclease with RNAse H fold